MLEPKLKEMSLFLIIITLSRIAAITLCPCGIYFKRKQYFYYARMVNHEKIHWKQQLELLVLFFYILYFTEWIIRLIIWPFTLFSEKWKPYHNISFERESYNNDDNLKYLETRKRFSWLKYIFHKT